MGSTGGGSLSLRDQFPDESDLHDLAVVDATLTELLRDGLVTKPGWPPSSHLYYLALLPRG